MSQAALLEIRERLIHIGDALQVVSMERLQATGWDRALFDEVLGYVEQEAPGFQKALVAYFTQAEQRQPVLVKALLAVDRLSAAYTYWTRLFPPRQPDESMFVLSLLHDLSEKVEYAITLLPQDDAQ